MNKLITKRIRKIESDLVQVNDYLRSGSLDEDTTIHAEQHRDMLDADLDFHMKAAPEEIARDVMPAEVALELLCDPKVQQSNRMRKTCNDARATYYQSVRERKPGAVKLASRLKSAKLTQLGKWLRRAAARLRGTEKQLRKLTGLAFEWLG